MKTNIIPNQNQIEKVFSDRKIHFAALFGSRAKGTAQATSDYDFLVEFAPGNKYSLLDIVALKNNLENVLGQEVDLITVGGINPKMANEIKSSQKVIYDRRKR
ncbi:MAG: hypothetical protein US31_C0019G0015 [Berkelbacteria bacterium GW2011_GWA1_36_9]|uniref:Polymerase beta nucleotidyltransferase domain-containing protein n=1 Tax=Berkelbacteria bacterium GW2011_GWA1_36_9 TaxID=1618331 RepID=A0A0G0FE82_9BACT|nr:MAG: hypothetical protein US31_C0019G0015 [Berkelbacteria bacterium GW2011_GWA1_36_9]